MKLIFRIILIGVLSYFLSLYAPWWVIIMISFLIGFTMYGNSFNVFISGFLGGGILWIGYAWFLDITTNSILSEKIVKLFPIDDPFLLIIAAGLIGGFSAGFGALSGNSFRLMFTKKKKKGFYN